MMPICYHALVFYKFVFKILDNSIIGNFPKLMAYSRVITKHHIRLSFALFIHKLVSGLFHVIIQHEKKAKICPCRIKKLKPSFERLLKCPFMRKHPLAKLF